MSLQAEAMREQAGDEQYITAGQHRETRQWHGLLMVNHPTPSGCARWMMLYSDKRGWPDAQTAVDEFAKIKSFEKIKKLSDSYGQ